MNKENNVQILHKNNTLIKGKYDLKYVEYKAYTVILHMVQKQSNRILNLNEDLVTIKLFNEDFIEIFNNDKQYIKRNRLENIFENLRVKKVKYYAFNNKTNLFDWSVFGFISVYTYDSSDKSFAVKIERKIYDMITNNPNGYTPINLELLLKLDGKYTFRFYELLRLWSGVKTKITYTIDELKEYLCLEDKSSYTVYANFKNKVITPAIQELQDLNLFEIEYKEIKEGRKVVAIDFIVEDLDPRTYVTNSTNNTVIETIVEPPIEPTFDKSRMEVNIEEPITPPPIVETINLNEVDENACSYEILDLEEMSPAVRKRFIKDFKHYNFSLNSLQESFDDALMITLEKDNVEVLGSSQYKHFRSTLIFKAGGFIKQDIEKFEGKLEAMYHGMFDKQDLTDVEKQKIKSKCSKQIDQLEKMQILVEKDAESIRK